MVRAHRVREGLHTLAGAYSLDALEQADRAMFERHLTRCEACAQEIRGLRETTAALGSAASTAPPRRLRERVLEAAARSRQYPPAVAARSKPAVRWRPWVRLPGSLPSAAALTIAAAAVAATVTLGVLTGTMQHRLNRADERSRDVAAVLTAWDAEMMTAPVRTGGRATVVMSYAKRMIVFSAKNLSAPPGSARYELWLIGSAGVRPACVVPRPTHGMIAPLVVSGLRPGDKVWLTVESAAGSRRPTAHPVLVLTMPS